MTPPRKPAWWQLYALVPVLAGLFVLDHRSALPPGWHQAVQAAIILVIYGLVWRWLRANAYALMTRQTLYHRHDYNGYDIDDWAHAMKSIGHPIARQTPASSHPGSRRGRCGCITRRDAFIHQPMERSAGRARTTEALDVQ
jgi:hypothetical protein